MNAPFRLITLAVAASAANGIATAAPSALVVHLKDFTYAPTRLEVRVGDTVTFVNDDAEAHTVTSSDRAFDSEGLDTNGTWKHTFVRAGTYAYFCELHPYMKGTIVVTPAVKNS